MWVTFTIWEASSANSDARAQAAKDDYWKKESKPEERKFKSKSKSGHSKKKEEAAIAAVENNPNLIPDEQGRLSGCWACGSFEHTCWEINKNTGIRICKQNPKQPTEAGKEARKAFNKSKSTWKDMSSKQRIAAVKGLAEATVKRLSTIKFSKKSGAKKKVSKSKDKKKEDDKPIPVMTRTLRRRRLRALWSTKLT